VTKNVEFAIFTQTVMITTVLLITGSLPNIEKNWIWDKYSLFTDGPYTLLASDPNIKTGNKHLSNPTDIHADM